MASQRFCILNRFMPLCIGYFHPSDLLWWIGAASKRGVLVKGSNYLEALNKVSVVVFDKTGTLTKGVFKVVDITVEFGFTKEQAYSQFGFLLDAFKYGVPASCRTCLRFGSSRYVLWQNRTAFVM